MEAFFLLLAASTLIRLFIGRKQGHGVNVAIKASLYALLITAIVVVLGSIAIGFPYAFMMIAILSPVIVPVVLAQIALSYILKRRMAHG